MYDKRNRADNDNDNVNDNVNLLLPLNSKLKR